MQQQEKGVRREVGQGTWREVRLERSSGGPASGERRAGPKENLGPGSLPRPWPEQLLQRKKFL